MRKITLVFGLLSGAIVSLMMAISMVFMKRSHGEAPYGMVVGYASMLLAFCLIFIAIKTYRDKHLGGVISFGKAFVTGLWIAIIASLCYTITWVIIYKNFYPEIMDQMTAIELNQMRKAGKSATQIQSAMADMDATKEIYNTWPGLIGFTLLEILPLGIIVALISAAILRRSKKRPLIIADVA